MKKPNNEAAGRVTWVGNGNNEFNWNGLIIS